MFKVRRISLLFFFFSTLQFFCCFSAEFRIITCQEPPANFIENGQIKGISVDIVKKLQQNLKLEQKIEFLPWARAYNVIAKTTPNILVFTCGKSPERINHGFQWIGPIITRNHVLWKKKENPLKIDSIENLKSLKVTLGGVRKDWRTDYFKDLGLSVDESDQPRTAVSKFADNRISLLISSDIELAPIAKELNLDITQFEVAFIFKVAPSFLMISKGSSPELVKRWTTAFEELKKSKFMKKTADKWSKKLNSTIIHSTEHGFQFK